MKIMRKRAHVQKRYLLWPLRYVLGILNGKNNDNDKITFQFKDDLVLTFELLYKFIKSLKQNIFNKKYTGYKDNLADFHAIVEKYSRSSESKNA